MKLALSLAKKGTGKVSPNPRVGAVIVKNDKILSTGYHEEFGGPHAEINAINRSSKKDLNGSTLYVTLEPCSHFGKTPPCVDAIIDSNIKKVIIGMVDPNPLVAGKGIQKLKENGIQVQTNVCKDACFRINEAFAKYIVKHKPFVTAKVASTLDGNIATKQGNSKWITNEKSRRYVHKIRHENDAILVGIGTVLEDNPSLTVRLSKKSSLKRFVLDSSLKIPLDSAVLLHPDRENTIIVTTENTEEHKVDAIQQLGCQVWKIGNKNIKLALMLTKMGEIGITSLLVEGGGKVHTSFLNEGLIDRMLIFYAPKLFGRGIPFLHDIGVTTPENAITFNRISWQKMGDNMLFEGRF